MIEKQNINGRDVWLEIEAHPVNRENPRVIPTEYFTARYYLQEPGAHPGELMIDTDGNPRLFESPVAALQSVNEKLSGIVL